MGLTTDAPVTLSYAVTRTITLTVDVTPAEAAEVAEMGETLSEYAAAVADVHPASAWNVIDETVTPA